MNHGEGERFLAYPTYHPAANRCTTKPSFRVDRTCVQAKPHMRMFHNTHIFRFQYFDDVVWLSFELGRSVFRLRRHFSHRVSLERHLPNHSLAALPKRRSDGQRISNYSITSNQSPQFERLPELVCPIVPGPSDSRPVCGLISIIGVLDVLPVHINPTAPRWVQYGLVLDPNDPLRSFDVRRLVYRLSY